jgi:hypothetical protein
VTCTNETHAALKADVHAFCEGTRHIGDLDGLRYGVCTSCDSTLVMPTCVLCFELTPSGDSLPHLEGYAHFGCLVKRAIRRGKAKVVAMVKVGKAKEMR